MEICGRCGVPVYVRLAAVWNDDGTITGRFAGSTRVVQIYSSEINYILDGISERIGLDISRIVVEGERKAGVQFTWSIFGKWKVSVDEAGTLRVRVENPFSEELLAGRVLGIYRALWADPARVEWTPDTEGYTVIEATGDGRSR